MSENDSALTLEHLQWFGLIIQGFARAEHIMVEIMGRLHGVRHISMTIITVGLSYSGKLDALRASLRAFEMPEKHKEMIRWHLGEIGKFSPLRNAIAHAYWRKGARAGSVKPAYYKTRGGILEIVGFDELEEDYTPQDLERAAGDLISSIDRLDKFRSTHGYLPLLEKRGKASN